MYAHTAFRTEFSVEEVAVTRSHGLERLLLLAPAMVKCSRIGSSPGSSVRKRQRKVTLTWSKNTWRDIIRNRSK